jgi:hypothetical protein
MKRLGIVPDLVINVDTSWEWPEITKHLDDLEAVTWPIKRIKVDLQAEAITHGWPHIHNRWCTGIKIKAIRQAIREHGGTNRVEVIGIAADEEKRAKSSKRKWYPLVAYGISQSEALAICKHEGFDFGGLYEKRARVSCYCCPLQRWGELKQIRVERPELWQRMSDCEKAMEKLHDFKQMSFAKMEAKVDAASYWPVIPECLTLDEAIIRGKFGVSIRSGR